MAWRSVWGEEGMAVLPVLVVVAIISAIGFGLVGVMNTDITHATIQGAVSRSYFVTQAGLQDAIVQLKANPLYRTAAYPAAVAPHTFRPPPRRRAPAALGGRALLARGGGLRGGYGADPLPRPRHHGGADGDRGGAGDRPGRPAGHLRLVRRLHRGRAGGELAHLPGPLADGRTGCAPRREHGLLPGHQLPGQRHAAQCRQ